MDCQVPDYHKHNGPVVTQVLITDGLFLGGLRLTTSEDGGGVFASPLPTDRDVSLVGVEIGGR